MKIKFDPGLDFQRDAIAAVVDLFEGQGVRRTGFEAPAMESDAPWVLGNRRRISDERLLANLQKIQLRNGLPICERLDGPDFSVEMETGTGKTYVYLRTAFELYQKYGFRKFIIVVPSIAIKEGVYKTLQMTTEHIKGLYENLPYDYFVYDPQNLGQVRSFAAGGCVQVMVINIDAFRKSFKDPEKQDKSNVIHRVNDRLMGERPIDLISATNPVVIIDEPQSVDTTPKSRDAILSLNPLCTLRYSATHKERYHQVYRLDAVQAYQRRLVKQIEVAGLCVEEEHNAVSCDEDVFKRMQIRRTIQEHLDKELRFLPRGIKVLSLFFIDRVANYREYDQAGNPRPGKYALWFDEVYAQLMREPKYKSLLGGADPDRVAEGVHGGYFAKDKKSDAQGGPRFKDSRGPAATRADQGAYQLIMRDKEKLISFDSKLKFIFSHSALKEGWDSPNVFQICTLNETGSVTKKRQEIGRGLRIAVNQDGERVHDVDVNTLTVVANESYESFARQLQQELEHETGCRLNLKNADDRDKTRFKKAVLLDVSFNQRWQQLKTRMAFRARIDVEQLVLDCVDALRRSLRVEQQGLGPRKDRSNFGRAAMEVSQAPEASPRTDLRAELSSFDVVSILEQETSLTRKSIVEILLGSGKLDQFKLCPQQFVEQTTKIIKDQLRQCMSDERADISIGGQKFKVREIGKKNELFGYLENAMLSCEMSGDGGGEIDAQIGLRCARHLELSEEVLAFAKLPCCVQLESPRGPFKPDLAVVVQHAQEHRIYLLADLA